MPVIGITGGVASGKSTVTRRLAERLRLGSVKAETFSADDFSHFLLEQDEVVREELREHFGSKSLREDGSVDRAWLRGLVFDNPADRQTLEAILHPKIRRAWLERAAAFRSPAHYFVAEIPLLYETNSASCFDCIVVVEADAQVQLERLSSKRGWSLETARRVIDAQMPAAEKIRRANILILNHHTEKLLHRQVDLAAEALLMRYA